jgi:hypothetical protein
MMKNNRRVFDGDFSWLDGLPNREKVPCLLSATERYKTSPVFHAVLLHYAEVDDLPRLKYPELSDPAERKRRFFDEFLPKRIAKSRPRLSEYRKVGATIDLYHQDLISAGVDLFHDDVFSNLLKLSDALKTHAHAKEEVFKNVGLMKARVFSKYAEGTLPEQLGILSTFEDYLHEQERLKSLLSL